MGSVYKVASACESSWSSSWNHCVQKEKQDCDAMRLFGWLVLSVLSLLNRLLVSSSKTPTLSFWIIRAFQQQQVNDNDANDFDSAGRESQHAWNLFGRIDERTDQYVIQ